MGTICETGYAISGKIRGSVRQSVGKEVKSYGGYSVDSGAYYPVG